MEQKLGMLFVITLQRGFKLPYKEGPPQFTTVPIKPLTDHRGQRSRYISLKCSVKSRKIAVYAISIPIELTAADVTFMKKPAFDQDQLKV